MKNTHTHPFRLFLSLCLFLIGTCAFAQKSISGKVTAVDDGSALIGASVFIKGSTVGTVTDLDGAFTLQIPDGSANTLVVSYTGYSTLEVDMGTQTSFDLKLKSDVTLLQEAVVTGYGTQSRRDITPGAAAR